MAKKIHYEVELKKTYELQIIPVDGSTKVQVDQGALVFTDTGPLGKVLHVFAPGEWASAKRVEAD